MKLVTNYFKNQKFTKFGDELVEPILGFMNPGAEIEHVGRTCQGKILCIGSELAGGVLKEGDTIWGYGAKYDRPIQLPEKAILLATRGPMTRKLIQGVDGEGIYGDPAILMPLIYTPTPITELTKTYRIGVIPHYVDYSRFKDLKDPAICVINVKDNPFKIIDQIEACEIIISTSLHGCIVAEAYGKIVVWLQVSDKIHGAAFKFNDYFTGSGRAAREPVKLKFTHSNSIGKAARGRFWLPEPKHDREGLMYAWRSLIEFKHNNGI